MRNLNLPTTIDTSRQELTREFFTPLLAQATRYDRGVSFFSSGWLLVGQLHAFLRQLPGV